MIVKIDLCRRAVILRRCAERFFFIRFPVGRKPIQIPHQCILDAGICVVIVPEIAPDHSRAALSVEDFCGDGVSGFLRCQQDAELVPFAFDKLRLFDVKGIAVSSAFIGEGHISVLIREQDLWNTKVVVQLDFVIKRTRHAFDGDNRYPGCQCVVVKEAKFGHRARTEILTSVCKRLFQGHRASIGGSRDADGISRGGCIAERSGDTGTALARADAIATARVDDAAGDGDCTARFVFLAAANACAETTAGRDITAAYGDLAWGSVAAAADARALPLIYFGGRDGAAVDGDITAVAVVAAADARAVAAVGCDRTSVDGDRASGTAVPAADARDVFTAVGIRRTVCGDIAAVDGDRAAVTIVAAADSRTVSRSRVMLPPTSHSLIICFSSAHDPISAESPPAASASLYMASDCSSSSGTGISS